MSATSSKYAAVRDMEATGPRDWPELATMQDDHRADPAYPARAMADELRMIAIIAKQAERTRAGQTNPTADKVDAAQAKQAAAADQAPAPDSAAKAARKAEEAKRAAAERERIARRDRLADLPRIPCGAARCPGHVDPADAAIVAELAEIEKNRAANGRGRNPTTGRPATEPADQPAAA